jgi:hypothetical protein
VGERAVLVCGKPQLMVERGVGSRSSRVCVSWSSACSCGRWLCGAREGSTIMAGHGDSAAGRTWQRGSGRRRFTARSLEAAGPAMRVWVAVWWWWWCW